MARAVDRYSRSGAEGRPPHQLAARAPQGPFLVGVRRRAAYSASTCLAVTRGWISAYSAKLPKRRIQRWQQRAPNAGLFVLWWQSWTFCVPVFPDPVGLQLSGTEFSAPFPYQSFAGTDDASRPERRLTLPSPGALVVSGIILRHAPSLILPSPGPLWKFCSQPNLPIAMEGSAVLSRPRCCIISADLVASHRTRCLPP